MNTSKSHINKISKITIFISICTLYLAAEKSHAIDCSKAARDVENIICNNKPISNLDTAMNENYGNMMNSNISNGARQDFRFTQKKWLTQSDNCLDRECVANLHKTRLNQMYDYSVLAGIHPTCNDCDDIPKFIRNQPKENEMTQSKQPHYQAATGTNINTLLDQKRLEFAKETIRLYGEMIPSQAQEDILKQQVTIGMTPYEAKLAGGAFYYKVEADPKVWPSHANPLVVIDKQSVAPDESKIWMLFETETQFPEEGKTRFEVYFHNGKAQAIRKILKQAK